VTEDVIALDPSTPNLDVLLAKFVDEHHHTDDEVRFVVAGAGVFEINVTATERVVFTAEPGDLIVVPAWRRHLFYLTEQKSIRCIRLFKDKAGWEAHYPYAQIGSKERVLHFA
jgi:1,2-dihydroxy-3-keto-5-methylthiopentene dioxygenase